MSLIMDFWNGFNKILLTSPLHGISSKNTVLVTFQGRKSGREYTTPVNYSQQGNLVFITSFQGRKWWTNLKSIPEVTLTLRGKQVKGIAEVIESGDDLASGLREYLTPIPRMARYFNVGINEDGSFNQEDLVKSVKDRVVIKVTLDQ